MQAHGLHSLFPYEDLSVMGFVGAFTPPKRGVQLGMRFGWKHETQRHACTNDGTEADAVCADLRISSSGDHAQCATLP